MFASLWFIDFWNVMIVTPFAKFCRRFVLFLIFVLIIDKQSLYVYNGSVLDVLIAKNVYFYVKNNFEIRQNVFAWFLYRLMVPKLFLYRWNET